MACRRGLLAFRAVLVYLAASDRLEGKGNEADTGRARAVYPPDENAT